MARTSAAAAGAGGGTEGGEDGGDGGGCLADGDDLWPWLLCADDGPAREESVARGRAARRRSTRKFLVVVAAAIAAIAKRVERDELA